MLSSPHVVVVDDDPLMCNSLKLLLEQEGCTVSTAGRGADALELAAANRCDLFLVDSGMPLMGGMALLAEITRRLPQAPVIMMTGNLSVDSALTALKNGAYDYIKKPFESADLIRSVKNALDHQRLKIENLRIQKRLESSEKRYRFMVQNSPDMIYTLDRRMRFIFVNEAFERLLGYGCKTIAGRDFMTIVHPSDRERARWLFKDRRSGERVAAGVEIRLLTAADADHFLECEVKHTVTQLAQDNFFELPSCSDCRDLPGTYGVARDISYRKQLESQLRHAQKMEAIGTLAGGIAHDFNNILMGIQGYASLALMSLDDGHPSYEKVINIEEHVQNGAELTRQLLGFARGGKFNVTVIDPVGLIAKSTAMFGRTKKEITIYTRFQEGTWPVEADPGQLKQVMVNLFVNAWQSMPAGGDLIIKTTNAKVTGDHHANLPLKPGNYVKITVSDTGSGIDRRIRHRIFEPFFTTKERSRGTGLGLASAYGIVKNHGGIIQVFSKEGIGTTFVIYLPATPKRPAEDAAATPRDLVHGRETVLIVDDEDQVIEVTRQMLGLMGYNVLTARSGAEAIAVFTQHRQNIDLLILDMIMPDMDGGTTFDHIKKIDANVKVLLSSGYSLRGEAEKILGRGCRGFVQKPFSMEQISQKIRDVLG
ncbi:MAG: response regulator [Desulfobacterales bacterium]